MESAVPAACLVGLYDSYLPAPIEVITNSTTKYMYICKQPYYNISTYSEMQLH